MYFLSTQVLQKIYDSSSAKTYLIINLFHEERVVVMQYLYLLGLSIIMFFCRFGRLNLFSGRMNILHCLKTSF